MLKINLEIMIKEEKNTVILNKIDTYNSLNDIGVMLDNEEKKHLSGESKSYTIEESIKMYLNRKNTFLTGK